MRISLCCDPLFWPPLALRHRSAEPDRIISLKSSSGIVKMICTLVGYITLCMNETIAQVPVINWQQTISTRPEGDQNNGSKWFRAETAGNIKPGKMMDILPASSHLCTIK